MAASDYGYDTAGRLIQVTKTPQGQPALTTSYTYDANGNRLSKTEPGGTVTQGSYDAQDQLLSYGTASYTYNSNGDLTSKTQNNATVTYDYDVVGNLRKVVLDNGQVIDYVIDGKNRRIGKKIDGQLVQGFLFDDQLRPIAELDGSNQVVATFVYGTHVNVPELVVKGGTTYRMVHDHLGLPRLVIDQSTGTLVQRMDYEDYLVLSTVHSAKGQEWEAVHGLNVTDGSFPSEFATGRPELIDEERRLLYVAMTRARQELHLLAPVRFYVTQQAPTGDRYVHGARSRFLTESVLQRFQRASWPTGADQPSVPTEAQPKARVDIAAQLRGMW